MNRGVFRGSPSAGAQERSTPRKRTRLPYSTYCIFVDHRVRLLYRRGFILRTNTKAIDQVMLGRNREVRLKIMRGQQIEKACGQRTDKYRMDCLFLKKNVAALGGRAGLAATDGRQITVLAMDLDSHEVEGLIPPQAVLLSRSVDGRLLSLANRISVVKGHVEIACFTRPEGEFPSFDVPAFLPVRPDGRAPIHVNSDYLAKMGDAIGARSVRIWPGDGKSACRVELCHVDDDAGAIQALCAVMPIWEGE